MKSFSAGGKRALAVPSAFFFRVGKLSRKYYVYALLCFLPRQIRWRTEITMCIVIWHTKIVYPVAKGLVCMCVSLLESKLYDIQVEAKCTHKPGNNKHW